MNLHNRPLAFETLPAVPGSYALHLRLTAGRTLFVGRLGPIAFPAGEYLYLGSALGPGGLRAWLGRHLRGDGRPRWHIDALRIAASAQSAWWAAASSTASGTAGSNPPFPVLALECRWSQALAGLPGASIPALGFGAGDCRSGCRAHLVGFPLHAAGLEERIERALAGQGVEVNSWYNWESLSP